MSEDLTDFLLARIAEDEERGRSLVAEWRDVGNACQSCGTDGARVLAECEAKRRIVGLHAISVASEWVNPPDGPAYQEPERTCAICGWVSDACDTVKALAMPYADHEQFQEEWRQ